uniref:protein-tyrosine-phosphatase n=1 Tax=Mesocestoides corti TaxID=53468 RepID=A0A5K3ESB3_MESCO
MVPLNFAANLSFVLWMLAVEINCQWFNLEVLKSYLNNTSQARIIQPPRDVAVLDGEDAMFYCGVEGNPQPSVTFLIDGQSGRLSKETGRVTPTPDGGSFLRLFKVTAKQSGIKIECLASNHVGNDRASASLKVYEYTDDVPVGFPKFIHTPRSHSTDVGKPVQLECAAEGKGDLTFLWLKNGLPVVSQDQDLASVVGVPLDTTVHSTRYNIKSEVNGLTAAQQPLSFENVNTSDDAYYECVVITKIGSIISSKAHLAVKDTFYPPSILEQQERVEVRPGKGANLTCTASGNPQAQVRWLTDQEKPLTEAVEWRAMLFLTDVTEPRVYICVANNNLGQVQHAVRVDIVDVPRAPVDLECIARGPTHANLRWFPGRAAGEAHADPSRVSPVPITSYTLIVTDLDAFDGRQTVKRKLTDISPWKIQADGSVQLKVTDLKPDHRYTAEVYALSTKFGISDASNQIAFRTLESPPGGPPLSIHATATSGDSITVSWRPPMEPNGKINGYKVYYSTHLRTQLEQWQVLQTSKTHAVLQDLVKMATYYIRVNAFNSAGDGPMSDVHPIIVNPGVPPQPSNFRGVSPTPTAIQLIWSPPEMSHDMAILDYQLQCRPASEAAVNEAAPQIPLAITVPPNHTGWILKSLQPDTMYQVSLSARTKHGTGVPARLEIRTLSNLPTPPQDLTLDTFRRETAVTGGGMPVDYIVLKLQWKPPEETFGELKGYQVSFRLVGPPDLLMTAKTVEGDAGKMLDGSGQVIPTHAVRRNVTGTSYTSTQIDNIQFGRIYQFEVAAYNNIDIGVPAHLNITTPENVPGGFPLHLRVRGLSANSVELSWSPPPKESRNGRIIAYQVHYYEFSSPQNTANYLNTTQPLVRIDGLQERTVYTFRVRAFTSSGPGPWSASNTIRTTAEVPHPPLHIKAERINQRQIKVTWSLSSRSIHSLGTNYHQRPIPVTGFRIYYAAHDTVVDPSSERILEVGAVTMATLDDVSSTESYIIKIQSRGTDKRFGNWSEPVIVSANRYGVDQRVGGYQLRRVEDLRCFALKADDQTNLMDASLRLTWLPPLDRRMLKEYEIRVSGVKSYINELNDPVRLTLGPRKLIVTPTRSSTGHSGDVALRNDFLPVDSDTLLVHTIDKLEPNAVIDVEVRPVYETPAGRQIDEVESFWEQTSCRTGMQPPTNITAPVPVAFRADANEVVMRLLRVSENLGPIRRYYLIVSSPERARAITATDNFDWHAEILRVSPNQDGETRLAAEFTQLAFETSQLEIQVGGRSGLRQIRRRRRSGDATSSLRIPNDPALMLKNAPSDTGRPNSEILLYDCRLTKGRLYRALLLACIYPDVQYLVPLNKRSQHGYFNGNSAETKTSLNVGNEDEDSISLNYCSASPWSLTFTPDKNLIVANGNDLSEAIGVGDPGVNGPNLRASPSFFTIILVTVIIGLGLVAVICIAVQCFFRRRPKQQRNSIGAKLPKADNSLKVPLMPPASHNVVVPGIDPVDLPSVDVHNKDFIQNSITPAASPIPTGSRVNSPSLRSSKFFDNGALQHPISASSTPARRQTQSSLVQPLPGQSPISLDHLAVHVANLKCFDNSGLYKEYEAIEPGGGFTWQNANMELNKPKNRYANVIAYDHSRVLLSQLPGVPCSDYINANYLDGYRRQNAYIATQGPLPETFGDFWRMVWEQNSRVIVMMTKLEERSRLKCDQYWPTRGSEVFPIYPPGDLKPPNPPPDYTAFSVTLVNASDYAYYTIRTFNLQKVAPSSSSLESTTAAVSQGGPTLRGIHPAEGLRPVSETRQIKQFQFTAWPDCGAPERPQPLLLFTRQVSEVRNILNQQHAQRSQENGGVPGVSSTLATHGGSRIGPTIVHCSAGVGRTGAFIVIDSQLERMKAESSVDIFGSVSRMRTQRNFMVQTEQQYAFLYEVVVEAAQVAGSEVTAHSLYNYVMKLRQPAPTSMLTMYLGDAGKTGFQPNITALELEFQRVSINLQVSGQCTSALLPENRNKNRVDYVLPYESNRVILSTIRGVEGADYINASFIDGYWHEKAYIATQAPLASTTNDFWRMIWEHNSPIIVMLSETTENGREQCFQYWACERSQRYQQFLLEPMVEYNMPSFVLREFRLTDTQDGQSRTVRQFQFSNWPDNGVAISRAAETLIELVSQVHKTQAQFGQDGPITVHCNAGAGRTGIFIALSILLERMRCEGMVDLLLTVRLLRGQRSQMIENESQYAFCYTALLEYFASFEH